MTEKVTAEEVRRVAELANLELSEQEEKRMQRDLNAILEHVAQMSELDTANVPALAQVSELLDAAPGEAALRADQVAASLSRAAVTPAAPESDGVFFKVPKVIER